MTPAEALEYVNVRAFLRAIRLGEGTQDEAGYQRIVGGSHFTDFADHPRKSIWIPRYKLWSTAAGAYQIIAPTWDEMRQRYRLPDFSPSSQDLAAVGLLIRRRSLDDVLAGRIESAIEKCRLEWASLPGSPYGQRTESLSKVLAEYEAHGGRFAESPRLPVPALLKPVAPVAPPLPEESPYRLPEPEPGYPLNPPPAAEPFPAPPDRADAAPISESQPVYDRERGGWIGRALAAIASAVSGRG